ncbi:hypothetical protein BH11PLA1_BH11PLA1_09910 [soil metagenome]
MQPGATTRIIAATLALAAFIVSIAAGLSIHNPADVILSRALACMFAGLGLGFAVGLVLERIVAERAAQLAELGADSAASSTHASDSPR